jgi:hypothetical protein
MAHLNRIDMGVEWFGIIGRAGQRHSRHIGYEAKPSGVPAGKRWRLFRMTGSLYSQFWYSEAVDHSGIDKCRW